MGERKSAKNNVNVKKDSVNYVCSEPSTQESLGKE